MMVPATVSGGDEKIPANNSENTILFAEADGPLQVVVGALLNQCGYEVILANSGKEALQKASEFDGMIHLLLADVDMPGMIGIELAIELNQQRPDTKILLASGMPAGMRVLNNGWQFLPKPFVVDMLKDRIRDFLSEQPTLKSPAITTDPIVRFKELAMISEPRQS